ncbi:Omp28-related outer membrane protein [Flavobacterium azooxidireducens]|uniref:Omp28-related outer membrane protein n=1 Tax=Flavobacterium azooxidireducens TaxID=1871076 RepID=A0ABY4KC90_9FLAO|nr:Omp28-related outer membrane protein [Flavobacterium azooxidireducens]UPQ78402.1 Omp28-related outer membrane protein [Flavobacterium azooxidireducens]
MNKFGLIGVFVAFFCCFSCSTDYTILDPVESISLTADSSVKVIGETIVFSVTTNAGTNITDEATIYVNNTLIDGNTFTGSETGDLTIKAEYLGVESAPITIRFHDGSEINFVKRVLIEDYTGTWCGNCPRVNHAVELAYAQTDKIVTVGIHRSSSNPADANYDPYNFDSSELEAILNMSGYPKALLNRMTRWQPLEQNNVTQVINLTQGENPKLGLAMDVSIVGSTINLDTKVKFSKDFSNLKLVVYVLENGLTYDQVNYTNFYTGPGTISNFLHDHVLKACLTPLLGEAIANSNTAVGQTYTKSFSVPIPNTISNLNNIEFVAFIVDENNKTINVRKAGAGDNQDFEEL